MRKRLIANNGRTYYIDRDKVSAMYEEGGPEDMTVFIIEGTRLVVQIHFEQAMTWFTTAD